MEPLLPKERGARLSELTCEILKAAGRLTGQVHSAQVLKRMADLVRAMNCYYSNLIEGHKTIPRDIERAMKRDFSRDPVQRDNQQLSLAHIAVEKLMEERMAAESVDACLAAADRGRRSDLDGRGNLSDAALADFCVFFLETMFDQIQFMSGRLGLPTLRTRVERYFQFQALHLKRYREEMMGMGRRCLNRGSLRISSSCRPTNEVRMSSISAAEIPRAMPNGSRSGPIGSIESGARSVCPSTDACASGSATSTGSSAVYLPWSNFR